uniref:hypothetical protein n=1 Tax=Prevotellaceae TaxID=171552 RepID=UPI0040263F3E
MIVIVPISGGYRSYQRYPSFLSAWSVAPMSDTHLSYERLSSFLRAIGVPDKRVQK